VGPIGGLDVLEKKEISSPYLVFFFFKFSCTLYFIRTCFFLLIVLHSAFCLLLTTHNIHAAGGFRTRNISKRSAADPRFRPLSHWDR
jgi:hypothetical protein